MQQICYASTSTSDHVQLLQDVRDILREARDFNALHNIQVFFIMQISIISSA